MAGRENPSPKALVSIVGAGFAGSFHTLPAAAATFVSKGCGGYTRHLSPEPRTQRLTGRNRGVSNGGWYHYPRSVLRGSETLRGRVSERRTLPLFGLGRVCSRRAQRACVTAMRMMRVAVTRRRGPAGLRDPIAVSLTALIGFTVLADRDYRVRKKADFVFMRRAALPALPAPSAALLYALMH